MKPVKRDLVAAEMKINAPRMRPERPRMTNREP